VDDLIDMSWRPKTVTQIAKGFTKDEVETLRSAMNIMKMHFSGAKEWTLKTRSWSHWLIDTMYESINNDLLVNGKVVARNSQIIDRGAG